MSQIKVFSLGTPIGMLHAALRGQALIALSLRGDREHFRKVLHRRAPDAVTREVKPQYQPAGRQLKAYFSGKPIALDAEVDLSGLPDFTSKVLQACHKIPYGQTATYGQLAHRAGNAKAARAVGQVMHTNPIPLFVP